MRGAEWPGGDRIRSTVHLAPEVGLPHVVHSIRRRSGYRLGYAESADGLDSVRNNEAVGIAFCYTAAVPANGGLLMFYNGNGYGRTGVGVAVAELD
jgi:hypothetical protein